MFQEPSHNPIIIFHDIINDMEKTLKNYILFFIECFKLSAFTFGGGYVIVALMQKSFVEKHKWVDEDEMLSFVAIAQSSPGAMAINTANLVGWKLFGLSGSIIAIIATIIPPIVCIMIISVIYVNIRDNKIVAAVLLGMAAGVAALIMDVVVLYLGKVIKAKKLMPIIFCVLGFAVAFFTNISIIYIILFSLVFGVLWGLRKNKDERGSK